MQTFMVSLFTCSISMSALALLYIALMPLIAKHYSEKGRYYAWLIIVIGLIIPFRPQWGNAIVKVDMPASTAAPIVTIGYRAPVSIPIQMPISKPMDGSAPMSAASNIPWWQIVLVVWLIGLLVFLAYNIVRHYRFLKIANRWSKKATGDTLTLLQNLKTDMGIAKQIELIQSPCVSSPMMIGFVKPRILLPSEALAQDELRFILKHELVHHKRRDLLYKYLVLAATAIHWFNPVVYLLAKAVGVLCEMSCDAEVVRNTDADTRQSYSETIIGIVKYKSNFTTALSTNFYGGKRGMKNRITSIMDPNKKKVGIAIIIMAIVITLGTGIVIFAQVNENTSNKTVLQKVTGLLDEPSDHVEEVLRDNNISYTAVNISSNPIMAGGDPHWDAYDLVCADGTTYVIILRKSLYDKSYDDFAAILDHEGRLIHGLIDNGVTPALFKNGEYIFSEPPSDSDIFEENDSSMLIQPKIAAGRSEFGNEDIVGYLNIPDTSIQYYVTQAKDNEFYMGHDIYKTQSETGWIFLDYENDFSRIDKNIIIYGHNPDDDIMFHGLRSYLTEDYAQSHRYFYLTTQSWNSGYEVFAVLLTDISFSYNRVLIDDSQFGSILDTMNKESLYDFGVDVTTDDRILTLSTYLNPNGPGDPSRIIVVGKLMGSCEEVPLSPIPLSEKTIDTLTAVPATTAEVEPASSSGMIISADASQLAYEQRIPEFFALCNNWEFMNEAYNNNFFVTLEEPVVSDSNGLTLALNRYILTGERSVFRFRVGGMPEDKISTKFDTKAGTYKSNIYSPPVQVNLKLKDGKGKTIFDSNTDISLNSMLYETEDGVFLELTIGEKNNSNWGEHLLEIPDILKIEIDKVAFIAADAVGGQWEFTLPVDDMFKDIKPLYYEVTNPVYCIENGIYIDKFYSTATATRMKLTIDNSKNSIVQSKLDNDVFLFKDLKTHRDKIPYEQKLFVEVNGEQLFETAESIPYEGYKGEKSFTWTRFVSDYYWTQKTDKETQFFMYLPPLYFVNAENVTVRILDESRNPIEVNLRLIKS